MNRFLLLIGIVALTGFPASVVSAADGQAVISGTTAGSKVQGLVWISDVKEGGLSIQAMVSGVPPGKHGFHIHENGSCDDGGKAAGGHYNPKGVDHGLLSKDGFEHSHAGDMGNITVNEDGTGELDVYLPGLSLTKKPYRVKGRAIILHEKEDDFGQPTGNAGGRIGCGIIEIIGSAE